MPPMTLQEHLDNLEQITMAGAQESLNISESERQVTETMNLLRELLADELGE